MIAEKSKGIAPDSETHADARVLIERDQRRRHLAEGLGAADEPAGPERTTTARPARVMTTNLRQESRLSTYMPSEVSPKTRVPILENSR